MKQAMPIALSSKRKMSRIAQHEARAAYAFLAPMLIGFMTFVLLPAIMAIGLAFFDYDILTPPEFIGLANFQRLLRDTRLSAVYANTLFYVVGTVTLNTLIGLALALGTHHVTHTIPRYIIRTTYFFPVLTSLASVVLVWEHLFSTDFGVINYYLGLLGAERIPWLTSSRWARYSIIVLRVWKTVGFNIVLYLAGLKNIPRHLYDAAEIDGAGRWAKFRYVTLPSLTPSLFFSITFLLISSLQVFDVPYILTGGGPGDASRSVVMYIYESAFRSFRMGYASTVALSLFVIVVIMTIVQFRLSDVWVFYR